MLVQLLELPPATYISFQTAGKGAFTVIFLNFYLRVDTSLNSILIIQTSKTCLTKVSSAIVTG
jgi:hypothetical protein